MSLGGSGSARVVALAGGVGAARFLRGLVRCVPPDQITAIVNTGDDGVFYGVDVCPDLDIVTYTLAGLVDQRRGYGLEGDHFTVIDSLAALGHESWFRLGDRDFATCLHRTLQRREGIGLARITDDLRRRLGVETRLLPMSEDPCPTWVELEDGRRLPFETYLVRDGAPDGVCSVDLAGARAARPAPGVIETIRAAEIVLLCPSNPVVSIGPILAVPGVREALHASHAPRVAVSPIVGGAPVKGPADRLLRGIGVEVSARGVASLYQDLAGGFVMDDRDVSQVDDVRALGLETAVLDTIMSDAAAATRVAQAALDLAARIA